ncbi:terminase small subunit [Paenisporosarcina sp. TG-14]|uniref:terminase small subunit n=1 Tax=Paenisporosarcina sp. TG-14 TaxID=1231057 RepID=UPI0002DEB9D5|nr:terminase small subunit [Paenisporosarcina sp. TG-14]
MKWEKIRNDYESSSITLLSLAEKHDVKLGTLKSRKSREAWVRDTTKKKKDATISKRMQPKEVFVESDDLTDKQRLFCIYYIKYFNATKAYQKAYGCAYSTAMTNGHNLLRNTEISKEIDRMKVEQAMELKLDVRDVLQKYIDIAFADITDFVLFGTKEVIEYDDNGVAIIDPDGKVETRTVSFVDFKDYKEVDGTLITEVKQGRDGVAVKLADKMKALEMLSKYFDLLSESDKKKLQEEKLKAEIVKVTAETKNEDSGISRVVIVNDKEAMRMAMQNDDD